MGKKGKDKKKGKGAERTAAKTEKKISNKMKKELQKLGEDDIESIVSQIENEEKKRLAVTESTVEPPSRRLNFSFIAHPDKEQLILYGGEYYNGQKKLIKLANPKGVIKSENRKVILTPKELDQKIEFQTATFIYNDLFFYNIPTNTWSIVKAPAGPPPRCGHQMVATSANKGQLWIFGGEFASPSQNQFYHYRDLWVYHISNKQWEKVTSPNGPSSRSGHRMVFQKKNLVVFGGFHDNLRDYKYFNDVHFFNTETYKWTKIEPSGTPPAPRSACCMAALNDGRVLIYGGYSKEKIKKDVDKGHVYTDAFILTPDKSDTTGLKWKWMQTKLGGAHFSPRGSMPMTSAPNNSASYCFGGVFDIEDDEEDLAGNFYNDFYSLDLDKLVWRTLTITGKREKTKKITNTKSENEGETEANMEVDEIEESVKSTTISDDGIFKVTLGPSISSSNQTSAGTSESEPKPFQPSPRINSGLAIVKGTLYLYGGMFEDGDKQITFCDFYNVDLKKLEEWKVLQADDVSKAEWLGSDSESSGDEGEGDSGEEEGDSGEEEKDSDMDTD